jgi:hypothetical protein
MNLCILLFISFAAVDLYVENISNNGNDGEKNSRKRIYKICVLLQIVRPLLPFQQDTTVTKFVPICPISIFGSSKAGFTWH